MQYIITIILLVGFLISGYFTAVLLQKNKSLESRCFTMDTSLFFFDTIFEEGDYPNKLNNISLAIMNRLKFDFVTFLVLDQSSKAKIIHSNVATFDRGNLSHFAEELLLSKTEPQIISANNGLIPYGEKRNIKYAYYVPLVNNENIIGCIMLEKESLDDVRPVEFHVFKTIITSSANAFSYLIFANELNTKPVSSDLESPEEPATEN